jgi:hypothetical protein
MALTVVVGGQVISGQLIPVTVYWDRLLADDRFLELRPTLTEMRNAAAADTATPHHLHLADVRVINPVKIFPDVSVLLRVALAKVSAWSPVTMQRA